MFLGVANGKWLIVENMQKITFYRTFLGSIINIVLNYLLIPRQGIIGAAIATLSTQAIVNFFFLALFDKTRITFWMQLNASSHPFNLFKGLINEAYLLRYLMDRFLVDTPMAATLNKLPANAESNKEPLKMFNNFSFHSSSNSS